MTFFQYDPTGVLEQNPAKGGVLLPQPFYLAGIVGAGQTLITASATKKFYVIWMRIQTGNAVGNGACVFKSGTNALTTFITAPLSTAPAEMWPPVAGNFWLIGTVVNEALIVDITGQPVNISGEYILVTP